MNGTDRHAVLLTVARYAAFLVLVCLYVRYWVTPSLHYEAHPQFPVFYSNVSFLKEFLSYPGGLARYLAGFLGLAYHSPWGGALVLTGLCGLLCWATDVLILGLGGRARVLAFGPAILLVVALNRLMGEPTAAVVLVSALLSMALYVGLSAGSDGRRIGVFLATGVPLHYAAGSAFLLFALLVGLFELLVKRRRLPALVSLLSMEAVPYVTSTWLYSTDLVDAFRRGSPWDPDLGPRGPLLACFLYCPLLMVGLAIRSALAARRARSAEAAPRRSRRRVRDKATPDVANARSRRTWVRSLVGTGAILLVASAAAALSHDRPMHRILLIDDCSRRGDWEGVLREARGLPMAHYTDVVCQHVNQALYETRRLGDEMFAYPQCRDWLIVDMNMGYTPDQQSVLMQRRADLWFQIGDLDLRLGLVNEAEHEAHEALALHGPHPEILKRLALVNLAKRQPDAARVFLNALRDNPVYAGEAAALLGRLATDRDLAGDPYVRGVRSVQLTHVRPSRANELHVRCRNLLADHPHNRMAFEYLMASCLLRNDLATFVQELPRMRDLGYRSLPRHYQEALLLYERETVTIVDRGSYAVSPAVLQSFADFSQAAGQGPASLAKRFGDTYFFYRAYGATGSMVPP